MKHSTRERLVEAARTLFWKHGYASTGIAQILKETDIGSGSLYYFFPTKEDLLLAVLEWYRENLWPAGHPAGIRPGDRSHRADFWHP